MQTISLDSTYNVRPDVFIKGAEDRLHVQYAGKNFILRLQREVINSLYDCLGRIDGIRPMDEVLTAIPVHHHSSALKFMDFLVKNRAAFRVADVSDELALEPVKDTLGYLRLYGDDSAGTFRRFEQARVLIVAHGFALISAVKTFARLGARVLTVISTNAGTNTGTQADWSETELQQCFAELRCWPDAKMHVLQPDAMATLPEFDHVLHIVDRNSAVYQQALVTCAGAEQLVAEYANGTLCLLRSDDYLGADRPRSAKGEVHAPTELVAGATAALFFFDSLCNIRRLGEGRYHYYNLRGESILHFGRLYRLLPVLDARFGDATVAKPVAPDLDRLLGEPLFPLQSMVEHTDPSSYIKLYSIAFDYRNERRTLSAAGRDKRQCQANLLAQLAALHGLWFDQTAPSEAQAVLQLRAAHVQAEQVVRPLRTRHAGKRRPLECQLSGQETYIVFCINAAFGQRVSWFEIPTGDADLPMCTLLCAHEITLFLPHGGELPPAAREPALLALYTALWQQRNRIEPVQDVVVTTNPFLIQSEPAAA